MELIDFHKQVTMHSTNYIGEEVGNSSISFILLFYIFGVTKRNNLKWLTHVEDKVKKAQQCLYFLRRLSKTGISHCPDTFLQVCCRVHLYWMYYVLVWELIHTGSHSMADDGFHQCRKFSSRVPLEMQIII